MGGASAAAPKPNAKSVRAKPAVVPTFAAAKKAEERKSYDGPRLIFFIAGGMTYSEIRSAAEVEKELQIAEILIGSTHIITPDAFVEDLKNLDPEIKLEMY